jgi:hypothetical protein
MTDSFGWAREFAAPITNGVLARPGRGREQMTPSGGGRQQGVI